MVENLMRIKNKGSYTVVVDGMGGGEQPGERRLTRSR